LGLLLRGQGIDLLACLDEAAVILLLELGADIVQSHQGGRSLKIIVTLDVRYQQKSMPSELVGNMRISTYWPVTTTGCAGSGISSRSGSWAVRSHHDASTKLINGACLGGPCTLKHRRPVVGLLWGADNADIDTAVVPSELGVNDGVVSIDDGCRSLGFLVGIWSASVI
jgi:hypothetical protein